MIVSGSFRSTYNQKVDAKARVSIPAPFRRVLEAGDPEFPASQRPRIVMVYGDSRRQFVECFTVAGMQALEAEIGEMDLGSAGRRVLERNFVQLSAYVDIDDDGRIVLPQKVREKTGITAEDVQAGCEATFAGRLKTFNLWKKSTFDAEDARQDALEADLLPEGVEMLSLLSAKRG